VRDHPRNGWLYRTPPALSFSSPLAWLSSRRELHWHNRKLPFMALRTCGCEGLPPEQGSAGRVAVPALRRMDTAGNPLERSRLILGCRSTGADDHRYGLLPESELPWSQRPERSA